MGKALQTKIHSFVLSFNVRFVKATQPHTESVIKELLLLWFLWILEEIADADPAEDTNTHARLAYYDNKNECEFANKATVNLAIQFESIKENGFHRKTKFQNEKWTCSVFFWELCFIVMIAAKRSDFCLFQFQCLFSAQSNHGFSASD